MYRLVLYVLLGLLGLATILSYFQLLSFSPLALVASTIFLLMMCWAWTGFVGRIDERIIGSAVPDYLERTYYLSGPPEMVRGCEQVLKSMHVKNDQVKKDFFPGLV